MSLVAGNVANAQTAAYVRRTLSQSSISAGGLGTGVSIDGINRILDQYVQSQLRTENAGGSYADTKAQFYQGLQAMYGAPDATGGLGALYNAFTTALQALSTSPEDYSARASVISSAQTLAQQLNTMTTGIQGLRVQADQGISEAVASANSAMQQITQINQRLRSGFAERFRDGFAFGSARPVHRPAVAVDGHPRRLRQQQSG